ncbi:peptidase, M28 family, partial [Candidatus Thiomargarita nelsonii]
MAIKMKIIKDMLIAITLILILLGGLWFYLIQMPNVSFQGKAPPLNPVERQVLNNLKTHIAFLANDLGGRNLGNSLATSKNHIIELFRSYGYQVSLQKYQVLDQTYANIEVELRGQKKPEEIIIIGAHYDSVVGSPGANDNGSGVAGILEIARRLYGQALSRTIRFVAFVNEEPPFFKTEAMGSL